MKTRKVISSLIIFLLLIANSNFANAQSKFSDCLLDSSSNQAVSLGKPLALERLGNKSNITIGVLPFHFSDSEKYEISEADKKDYYLAAKIVEEVSKNFVKVEIKFLPQVKSKLTKSEFKVLRTQFNEGWGERNLTKSSYGFVKDVLTTNDDLVDFSNLDTVILEGNNTDRSFSHAEAFGFFRSPNGNNFVDSNLDFFKSVTTNEGYIDNAVFLDSHKGPNIIAHELYHNFGLTDLYGSGTGPGPFSMMSSNASRILNYERAVLGWFPLQNIQCHDFSKIVNLSTPNNEIKIDNIFEDSIFMIKKSDEIAYVLEVSQIDKKPYLFVYLLEQNIRPPITMYGDPNSNFLSIFDLSDPKNIGLFYRVVEFDLLIFNQNAQSVSLNLIPKNWIGSAKATQLIEESKSNKELALKRLVTEAEAKAKAEAEAKAKAEAEAKAKAEAEAKAKTDADTKAKVIPTKTTITCIKGKTLKKVTAINPKCPAGYKKK